MPLCELLYQSPGLMWLCHTSHTSNNDSIINTACTRCDCESIRITDPSIRYRQQDCLIQRQRRLIYPGAAGVVVMGGSDTNTIGN